MKRVLGAAVALLAVGGACACAGVLGPATASANTECQDGKLCLWGQTDYEGCKVGMQGDEAYYNAVGWNNCAGDIEDKAESVKNRGNCNVRIRKNLGINTGPYVVFARGFGGPDNNPGVTIQDPNLGNGGGNNAGGGWSTSDSMANEFSSHDFCV